MPRCASQQILAADVAVGSISTGALGIRSAECPLRSESDPIAARSEMMRRVINSGLCNAFSPERLMLMLNDPNKRLPSQRKRFGYRGGQIGLWEAASLGKAIGID